MSRMPASAATALLAASLLASPAGAVDLFKRKPKAEAAQSRDAKAATAKPAAAAERRRPASAADRAAAERLPPLGRAAFWAREAEVDPTDPEAAVRLSAALRALNKPEEAVQAVSPGAGDQARPRRGPAGARARPYRARPRL
jgi:hypothetical protein